MESSIDYPSTTDIDFDISNIGIVSEDESKRGYDTKTFKKEDGSYLLAAYNQVIHYEENGVFKNINNSLVYDEGSSEYENSANKFKIKFPKEIKENKKFKLTLDEYKIEWQILDIDASVIEVEENQEKSNNIKELTNVNQKVIYKDIQPNVDLEYILSGNKIKENIILNKYIEDFSMTFEYQVKDLKLVRNEAGSYVFENGKGEVVFNFEQLYMVDKNHHTSNNVEISVNEVKEDLYQVTIIPDQIFLESAEYPIIIDPTITCGQEDSVLEHKYVNDYSQVVDNELMVGSSAGIIFRSYLNINIDQIKNNINFTSDKRITYANLNMSTDMDNTQDQLTILISEVLDSISYESIESITDITENSEIFDFNIIEYQLIGNTTLNFDIYAGFNDWMNQPETHRIIELKQLNEFSDVYMTFNPLGDNDSLSPFLELGYIDKAGIKDYWTYNTQDVGRVGTGYVSDYTGNLTFIRNDINFNTELQSLLAPFAYNSLDLETNLGYGIGWNTYYNSRVDSDPVTGQHYVEDYTGYKAYYIEPKIEEDLGCDIYSNEYDCYVNMDDGKTILKEDKTTGEYDVISELEGTTYHYNNSGYLIEINYKSENATTETTITIQRNPNRIYQVEAVTDSSGNMIDFVYDISTENLDYLILKTSSMGSNHLERVDYSIDSNDLLNDVTYYKNYDLQDGETLDYNVHYDYEYNDDGLLKKVKIDQSSVYDSYVIYVYNDNDQLIEIKMNHEGLTGYSYHIHYDSVGRMDYVEVNNQTIMSYDYYEEGDIETGEISSQTYGNGDQIVFTYTDDGLIEKVSYQGYGEALIDYYTYLYDDENKLAVYHDLVNGYTEYYEYHPNGDLAKITNSDDDVIEYAYDGLDNLSEISYEITDIEGYMNYHYQSELSNHLYAYTSYNQGGETIQKNYDYEDDAINRLQSITYTNNSN
jgi:YD repeat-containing protein